MRKTGGCHYTACRERLQSSDKEAENQSPMRADNVYQYQNCTVAFDAMTAEINFAEIR